MRVYHNLSSDNTNVNPNVYADGNISLPTQVISPNSTSFGGTTTLQQNQQSFDSIQDVNNNIGMSPVIRNKNTNEEGLVLASKRLWEQNYYLKTSYVPTISGVGRQLYYPSPSPTTQFYSGDSRISDSKQIEFTTRMISQDEYVRDATKLPLGMTIQPFVDLIPALNPAETTVPLTPGIPPLRCKRCRTYVNPFFKFNRDGSVTCNICKVKNQISDPQMEFHFNSGNASMSSSLYPQLYKGTVDFIVPETYNINKGNSSVPLHYLFLIDTSIISKGNVMTSFLNAAKETIEKLCIEQPNCKIGIIAFDLSLRFFNLSSNLGSPSEYIVNDLKEPFLPILDGLFVNPVESKKIILLTFERINELIEQSMFGNHPRNVYGSALMAAKLAYKTVTKGEGGKIICYLSSKPTYGEGNLSLTKDDNQKTSLRCDNQFFLKIGNELLANQISIDLYLFNNKFHDMSNICYPVRRTNGNVHYYPDFNFQEDLQTLKNDMLNDISKLVGYQGLLKVRCSEGLSVGKYYIHDGSTKEPMFGCLTKDTNLDIQLKYDDKIKPGSDVFFQVALLYTDLNGIRKVRTLNSKVTVANTLSNSFNYSNEHVILRIMLKDVIFKYLSNWGVNRIKEELDDNLLEIITQYIALISGNNNNTSFTGNSVLNGGGNNTISNGGSSNRLDYKLPRGIQHLLNYILGFEKVESMIFNRQSTRGNQRIATLYDLVSMSSSRLMYKLYPQIIPLHLSMMEEDFEYYDSNEMLIQMNELNIPGMSVSNSGHHITNGGCYLIFDGEVVYLWFNENTNPMLLEDLMGSDGLANVIAKGEFPTNLDTAINKKVQNIIKNWRQTIGRSANLKIKSLRPSVDKYYHSVISHLLVEDRLVEGTFKGPDTLSAYTTEMFASAKRRVSKRDFVKNNKNLNNAHENLHQDYVQF
ncbi:hypothetical protein TBLA_0A03530 [Henningerozyma blattae CBS 6284]|uniref:Uncharacterized protein n=1 Tax=Henningerozyma blattae (strain ATCC 34711 / CBS 6284 / DSM 70876 / NBRC 10599 / NRRL Y-10934 / UCD 77-7) TaxID=1071380 RepID=I2GVK0_HENB6|nr:hypothetical protein TBLA_0A03530 [Tetrapisispora blattae CBS 6284]CCH58152.1 hypothetical protein TBLA_0A03530 [Tetrapisispora blattae CBS 6284]